MLGGGILLICVIIYSQESIKFITLKMANKSSAGALELKFIEVLKQNNDYDVIKIDNASFGFFSFKEKSDPR